MWNEWNKKYIARTLALERVRLREYSQAIASAVNFALYWPKTDDGGLPNAPCMSWKWIICCYAHVFSLRLFVGPRAWHMSRLKPQKWFKEDTLHTPVLDISLLLLPIQTAACVIAVLRMASIWSQCAHTWRENTLGIALCQQCCTTSRWPGCTS